MTVQVNGKLFETFIDSNTVHKRILELGAQINKDYAGLNPLFLGILNGSFIFAADLFRSVTVNAEISFIKLASYKGTTSTGNVITSIGMEESIAGRHVIIVEDIIDTGTTLHAFLPQLQQQNPASLKIASLLSKPEARKYDVHADYLGFEMPDVFVVGYGLDYDGLGRNLPGIYRIVNQ
ncbi:MAG: hypoxanthine phosphoribosyltransferase [Bacteroidetes bacterium]|nr:hypoxanthine phosphoribosyltransferase [Bacteroidota bacterium]